MELSKFLLLQLIGCVVSSRFTKAPTSTATRRSQSTISLSSSNITPSPSNVSPSPSNVSATKTESTSGLHSTTCPDEWLPFHGSCYLFGHKTVSFTGAQHFCRQHYNSHLINVHSKLENDFIKDRLREFASRNWWLGMTDEVTEGTWQWFDTGEVANFTDWYPGQPDVSWDDCAGFYAALRFTWVDYGCLAYNYPICELRGLTCGETEIIG